MQPETTPNEAELLAVVKAARATVEDGINAYEHILDEEQIDYDECGAAFGLPLCGARACEECGCIVDKRQRVKMLETALAALDGRNP